VHKIKKKIKKGKEKEKSINEQSSKNIYEE
jgi:hypothetical protein